MALFLSKAITSYSSMVSRMNETITRFLSMVLHFYETITLSLSMALTLHEAINRFTLFQEWRLHALVQLLAPP